MLRYEFIFPLLFIASAVALDNWTECEYDGQKYKAGEYWNPDCERRCYCTSAAMNASVCQSRCTQYTHIPQDCRLKKVDGECCPRLSCDWHNKCRYKGKWYDQDEEFKIGCDYKCKCADAKRSFVQCQDICPTWTNVPKGCFLIPPIPGSGECCGKMSCSVGKK